MEGLVIGTVVANWDEEHRGMVQAEFSAGPEGEVRTGWIPVMVPFGGNAYGSYHLPDVGNTVVIGFEQGSGSRPLVIGCLWSQDNPLPPDTATENNTRKLWKSKNGYSFSLDEEEQQMALSDPDQKNRIIWSAKEKTVTVDAEEKLVIRIGGNQLLTLEQEKLTVTGALTIKAEKIMIEAESITAETAKDTILKGDNIRLSPKQKLRIEGSKAELVPNQGMTIKTGSLQAEGTTLELKATASGKLNSSGILELKGAMIKMN